MCKFYAAKMKKFSETAYKMPVFFCIARANIVTVINIIRLSLVQSLFSSIFFSNVYYQMLSSISFSDVHTGSCTQSVRKTKGIKATTQRNSLPTGYRISRVEENYYLRASRWLHTYLPSYWLSESNRTFLIPSKLLFIR